MLSCGKWFSAPSFWLGGGLESRCVGRVCGADCAHGNIRTVNTTQAAALKTIMCGQSTTQRSTECTSVAGHSSQHNITQHGMLPQYPIGTAKLM